VDERPLVERLRSGFGGLVPPVCDEAANELEALALKLHNSVEQLKQADAQLAAARIDLAERSSRLSESVARERAFKERLENAGTELVRDMQRQLTTEQERRIAAEGRLSDALNAIRQMKGEVVEQSGYKDFYQNWTTFHEIADSQLIKPIVVEKTFLTQETEK